MRKTNRQVKKMKMRKLAVLDMYAGHANQGMRCIAALAKDAGYELDVFEVRQNGAFPDVRDYSLFISTGGPGDPHEVEQLPWGAGFVQFLSNIKIHNEVETNPRKHAFLICHSFQMACIVWKLADVTKRQRPGFGIYPFNKTRAGLEDPLLGELDDPFYAIDSRDWQVIHPNAVAMDDFGARVTAIERERPHVPLERAAMAIRFTPEIFGTQFHPEADESGMQAYLNDPEKLAKLIELHAEDRIDKIREHLGDPNKVNKTPSLLIPAFLRQSEFAAKLR